MRWTWPWIIHARILDEITWKLARLERGMAALNERITMQTIDLQALREAVAANTSVTQSAIVLITGLTTRIQELILASGSTIDPIELQAIVDQVTADKASLADAVVANTPQP